MNPKSLDSAGPAMQHVNLDTEPDAVRRFLLTLSQTETALETNGHVVAYVIPKPATNGHAEEPWTDAKNARRCELIDRKYRGNPLTPEESVELNELQEAVSRHVQQVAPRPLDAARQLHQSLLMKATKKSQS